MFYTQQMFSSDPHLQAVMDLAIGFVPPWGVPAPGSTPGSTPPGGLNSAGQTSAGAAQTDSEHVAVATLLSHAQSLAGDVAYHQIPIEAVPTQSSGTLAPIEQGVPAFDPDPLHHHQHLAGFDYFWS